jgi:hypothetical protein
MKEKILFGATVLLAGSLLAVDSNPQDAVKDAAKSLGEKSNYSWTTTIDLGGDMSGTIEGKAEKAGATFLVLSAAGQEMDAAVKGDKGVVKLDEGWKPIKEVAEDKDQQEPLRIAARILQTQKLPAAEAADLASKTKELKLADGVYSGDLTADGIKELVKIVKETAGHSLEVSSAKWSVKFWLKDSSLSKYESSMSGTVKFDGDDHDVNMKTTVQIKDVGTTKVSVPEAAAKKL